MWHDEGMARTRVSTTVDEDLIGRARKLREGLNDAALLDEALTALVARHREAEIDAAYVAYDKQPLDDPDEWGDLASWRDAAGRSGVIPARSEVWWSSCLRSAVDPWWC